RINTKVSALGLVKKVRQALRATGGASSDYQHVIIELQGLENVLRQLEALEPTEDNVNQINAIRGMALACQIPLKNFLTKIEQYDVSMSPFTNRFSLKSTGHKTQWALSISEDVIKLRALVAAKVLSINLLLAMHVSQTVSRIDSRLKTDNRHIAGKIMEHRNQLDRVERDIHNIDHRLEHERVANEQKLDEIHTTADQSRSAILSLRNLSDQIIAFIGSFPRELRDFMRRTLQDNYNMYHVLLQIQSSITARPTTLLDSDIKFEDALGRISNLPYDYFRYWEMQPFEGLLKAQFKGLPGEDKISTGQYHIIDPMRHGSIVKQEDWTRSVFPGTTISMSILLSSLRRAGQRCPRPKCSSTRFTLTHPLSCQTCDLYGLGFFDAPPDISNAFDRFSIEDEEKRILAKQADEDLKLYGARSKPTEVVEPDEIEGSSLQRGQKRGLYMMDPDTLQPANKLQKQDSSGLMHQYYHPETASPNYSTMDWNSGSTPLDAWLNQSAIPSNTGPINNLSQDADLTGKANGTDEATEIEVFRRVHITPNTEADGHKRTSLEVETEGLELDVQIYFRNIMDRYPSLPFELARRLAVANHKRAERLQKMRDCNSSSLTSADEWRNKPPYLQGYHRYRSDSIPCRTVGIPSDHRQLHRVPKAEISTRSSKSHAQYTEDRHGNKHERIRLPKPDTAQKRKPSDRLRPYANTAMQNRNIPDMVHGSALQAPNSSRSSDGDVGDDVNFWTGAHTKHSASSHHSRHSSRNNSLRDVPIVIADPSEQSPIFPTKMSECSSYEAYPVRPSLPPPPTDIDNHLPIKCDLCGTTIKISRRLEWQKHVLTDLRPYVCIHPDCSGYAGASIDTYSRRGLLLSHWKKKHSRGHVLDGARDTPILGQCIFCTKSVGKDISEQFCHIGRHMEEIAFAVVPKQYEDWEFYSDDLYVYRML
ncbi:MAG: hypothetical protein Q9225_004564, partial [Loekoesia sp. 1 TL-2023]